jgi:putative flippase GtrA
MMKLSTPQKLPADFPRFVVTGGVGFAVDSLTLLALVHGAGWQPQLARAASIAVAMLSTWLLNRLWTFRSTAAGKSARDIGAEFLAYCSVQLTGAAASYAIYSVVVALKGPDPVQLMVAVGAGSAGALMINYIGARIFVFRPKA